jgi:stage V sporulation protein SpoVS
MEENKVSAASNPGMVNQTVQSILAEPEKVVVPASIVGPSNVEVTLPAGFITPDGEVIKTAEVRELNGKDEEAIARANGWFRVLGTILSRAVVKIGPLKVDDALLDRLILGDREALLLGIYKATFGPTTIIPSFCSGCDDAKDVEVDVDRDIPMNVLVDPISDRNFTVKTRGHEYVVTLPTGIVQRELGNNSDRTTAELTTLMLE